MTKPKLQNKCKLCNLIHIDRELWIDVHTRILKEGMKKSHVCAWLNKRVEIKNANLKPGVEEISSFNLSNFTTHFKKHVSSEDQMKAEIRVALRDAPRGNDGFSEEERIVSEAVADAERDALAESYKDYPDTVAKLETLIMRDLLSTGGITDANGSLKPNAADQRLKLLQSLMMVKKTLAEVQRTEQVGGSAVRHALTRVGDEVVSSANKLAIELREILKQQLPNSTLPKDVETMVLARTVETLKGVYPEILAEVYKLYGIK